MEIRAVLNNVRLSPRKVKLVIDLIRGQKAMLALNRLNALPQVAARMMTKLVRSAIANAKANHNLTIDDLWISTIYANQGPRLKRFTPRAMGRATPLLRPTAHITVVLSTKSAKVNKRS